MRNQKGITLVALVITIIVLLILAGVSISLVVGQNGVLNQASNAVVTNKAASVKEKVSTALASAETTYYTKWAQDTSTSRAKVYDLAGTINPEGTTTEKAEGYDGVVYNELKGNYTNVKIKSSLIGTPTADNVSVTDGSDTFVFSVSVDANGKATIAQAIKVYVGKTTAEGTPTTVTLK